MASFERYTTDDGHQRVLAVVRIKGFARTSKAFDGMAAAKEWAQGQERELRGLRERGGARSDITKVTIEDLCNAFLADSKVKQRRYYEVELKNLIASWVNEYGTTKVRAFGYLQIVAYREKLLGTGLAPARVNRYLSAMRRCWNWGNPAYTQQTWPQKIHLTEPSPEEINQKHGTIDATIEDVAVVIGACTAIDSTLGALAGFLIGTGARLGDALSVRWIDVDSDKKTVRLKGQKTATPLTVPLLVPAVEALKRAGTVKNVSGLVFWQYADRHGIRWNWLKARKAFPEHLRNMRIHDCRHLCASFLARSGASLVELQAQLGHKSLEMVVRYSSLTSGHRGAAHDKLDAAFGVQR